MESASDWHEPPSSYKLWLPMDLEGQYREYRPDPVLRPYVRAFFTYSGAAASCGGIAMRASVMADAHVSIVFGFGDRYEIGGLWEGAEPGHAIGPMTRANVSELGTQVIEAGAYLTPAGAARMTGVPSSELVDRVVSLRALWGQECSDWEGRIIGARSELERIRFLASALSRRLAIERVRKSNLDIAGIARQIRMAGGRVPIPVLAAEAGVSRQHLTREFARAAGLPPKLYSRLARFRNSLRQLPRSVDDLCMAALDLGYYDQSHMIADFRRFAGRAPQRLLKELEFHPFVGEARETEASLR
jgi:AraC-like DNA-binding protein